MKGLLLITCATIAVSLIIAYGYIPKAIVVWDEATHMDIAFTMYTSLRAGDVRSYIDYALHQTGYPPLMPIVSSVIFLFTGFSTYTARLVNLIWFVTSSVLLYLLGTHIGHSVQKKYGAPLVGTIASLLFITSPFIIILSSLFMREGAGISTTLASVYVYLLARKKGTVGWYAGSGFVVFLAIMAKYNLGFIVTLGIALEATIALFSAHAKKLFIRHHFILFGIIGMLFFLWMLYPSDKVPGLVRFLSDPIQYSVGAPSILTYLTYYPLAVLYVYTASIEIGIVLLFSFVVTIRFLHNPALRLMWIIVLINYVLATIHWNNVQERYIATSVPLLFCIGAFVIVYFVT
ncbi:glycosyltransferase family 39 protein, partial [Candidatus Gottesmanbacteria bacterium]|nr:glycosyltransferase family 39 protein [Candidatus Gottesmanbacteria bacterium]